MQQPAKSRRSITLRSALFALLKAKGQRRKHPSARTVGHVAGAISAALAEAVQQELLESNVLFRLKHIIGARAPPDRQRTPRTREYEHYGQHLRHALPPDDPAGGGQMGRDCAVQ